jgi:hypothetical protein
MQVRYHLSGDAVLVGVVVLMTAGLTVSLAMAHHAGTVSYEPIRKAKTLSRNLSPGMPNCLSFH